MRYKAVATDNKMQRITPKDHWTPVTDQTEAAALLLNGEESL
jgi:hypothetical protein